MRALRIVNICALMALTVGFRWSVGSFWDISIDEPTLWLELDPALYADDGFGEKIDDLEGALESLKGVPPAEQRIAVWRHILAEFASVETSFLRLRLKPGQIPAIDAEHNEAYDEAATASRTMKLKVGSSRGASSGYASLTRNGLALIGCDIVIAPRTLDDPQFFTHVLMHEILHCLGLDHQQDDSDSLLSYSNNGARLSLEERMAITHLYPLDPAYAKESPTFGLSCAPKKASP